VARAPRAEPPAPPFRLDALTSTSDGSALAVRAAGRRLGRIDRSAAAALALHAGCSVDAAAWERLRAALDRRGAFDAGTRLLAAHARSRSDLQRRLGARFGPAAAADAVQRLAPYLDDAQFAGAWVEERLRLRPLGPSALLAGLRRAGVAPELARAAVAAALGPAGSADERLRCLELARTRAAALRSAPPARRAARLAGLLARRGFSAEAVRAALRAVLPQGDGES